MKQIYLLLTFILAANVYSAQAQVLLSYEHVNDLSPAQVDSIIGDSGPYGVSIYQVVYTMLNHLNELDTVSGLYTTPINSAFPSHVVIYNHGTTDGPTDAPSLLGSGFSESLAFASFGFATATPDFIGLGLSANSFHPYVHGETEALSGLYFIDLAYQLMDSIGLTAGDKLFVAGYSQGAHAGMSLQKMIEIEFNGDIEITAAAYGSGPYSLSEVMYNIVVGDENYSPVGFIPYLIMAYQDIYGDLYSDLDEIFKPNYLVPIRQFRAGDLGLTDMTIQLASTLFFQHFSILPKNMFQDSILTRLETKDPNDPLIRHLIENNSFNFQSQVPTRLYYCEADDIVPFENTIYADSAMNAQGAIDLAIVHVDPNGTHGSCAIGAIPMAIEFFLSFTEVGVQDIRIAIAESVFPNPVFDILNIELIENNKLTALTIYQMDGKQIMSRQLDSGVTQLNVSQLSSGIYLLKLEQPEGIEMLRFVKE